MIPCGDVGRAVTSPEYLVPRGRGHRGQTHEVRFEPVNDGTEPARFQPLVDCVYDHQADSVRKSMTVMSNSSAAKENAWMRESGI